MFMLGLFLGQDPCFGSGLVYSNMSSGIITSPGYQENGGGHYEQDSSCSWTIIGGESEVGIIFYLYLHMKLSTHFERDILSACMEESLALYSVDKQQMPRLGRVMSHFKHSILSVYYIHE